MITYSGGTNCPQDQDFPVDSYSWDFGDGTTGSGSNPTHSYSTANTYTVKLTVTSDGRTNSTTHSVTITSPPPMCTYGESGPFANFSSSAPQPVGTPINFDGSGSVGWSSHFMGTGCPANVYVPVSDWSWDFGDGTTGSGSNPTHSYSTANTYTVKLTVTANGRTNSTTQSITVNPASCTSQASGPTASFTSSAPQPTSTAINFDGSGSGGWHLHYTGTGCPSDVSAPVSGWAWDFGDGTTGSGSQPAHSYAIAGTYTVKLTVTANGVTNSTTHGITVNDRPPIASFTSPASTQVGQSASFDASSSSDPDGSVVSYHWDFGDGTSQDTASPSVSHVYQQPGTKSVSLTVKDNHGQTDTTGHNVAVANASPGGGTGGKCIVPNVKGKKLKAARAKIRGSNCKVGKIKKPKHRPHRKPPKHKHWVLVVKRESPGPGSSPGGEAKVNLKLAYVARKK